MSVEKLEVKVERNLSSVHYLLDGPKEEVEAELVRISSNYPAIAYGTWEYNRLQHVDGRVTVEVKRSDSAD